MVRNDMEAPGSDQGNKADAKKSKKSPGKSRQTHFICLPLVTPTSIPQLQESLQRFRAISTASNEPNRDVGSSGERSWADHHLKVIPNSAHQALGKYHLTIGTMDLSDEVEMQRAKNLLSSLDLEAMLKKAERPDAVLEAKKWRKAPRQPPTNNENKAPVKGSHNEPSVLGSLSRSISPPPTRETDSELDKTITSEHISNDRPDALVVTLSGLGTFPSTGSARVFWAKPYDQTATPPQPTLTDALNAPESRSNPSSRLYTFALLIRQRFREAGFITETRPLVLHATVANIRQTVQPKGGRTSKGRMWSRGAQRWKDGCVDATGLVEVFDRWGGDVESARAGIEGKKEDEVVVGADEREGEAQGGIDHRDDVERSEDPGRVPEELTSGSGRFVWAKDIVVDRVALCKMGAERGENEILEGEWYPHLAEKLIYEQ